MCDELSAKIGLSLLVSAAWASPLARVTRAFASARDYFHETASIDAANDVTWNGYILIGYLLLLTATLIAVWFVKLRSVFWWGAVITLAVGTAYFLAHPFDTMIVIAPTSDPRSPVAIALVALTFSAIATVRGRIGRPLSANS